MSSFNIHQQVFGLSLASNLLTADKGTEAELQKKLDSKLQPLTDIIGNWEVVWGPRVWKSKPTDAGTPPDRVWYIAHNPSANFGDRSYDTYVLAIAGAAPDSEENYTIATMVNKVVDFNQWVQAGITTVPLEAIGVDQAKPYLSYGAALGMSTLVTVPSPGGQTIIEFLATIPPTSRLVFTGHSLGGVLSPIVALALLRGGLLRNAPANVFTYPTAGPSPGNGPFATMFAENFPLISNGPAAYQMWNGNLANTHDVVPYSWNIDSLRAIPTLYGTLPPELNDKVVGLVNDAIDQANASGLVYVPLQGQKFSTAAPDTPQTKDELLQIITQEHIAAYELLIVSPSITPLHEIASAMAQARGLPIFGELYQAHLEGNGRGKLEKEGA
ncbi:hypothetical protein PC9H_003972 [Pleurotus ostreatus]|uniref:Fungal lipase-type domain-containing protein n=1 Tax=Pleurotus ostreatus TaxID=5322 RepID=A0A8H7DYH5_PLEOS|nr:uncharacterized protein PC9H_003972 [Pleurotus ostreatus]KAF7437136.1 hypothetical protein PC9H_003972 [Pleurotus ostreatus]KAJ8703004.1 hypothetical protein PTI98_001664 [Pleurotus ostreatus]